MNVSANQGFWGYGGNPVIYDRFVESGAGQKLIDTTIFGDPSTALGSQLQSNNIFFNGPSSRAANGGARVKLYAPATWVSGSSYSHLDESAFPRGSGNALMTYALNPGEAIHNPGPVAMGIFNDIGWGVASPPSATATLTSTPTRTPTSTSTPMTTANNSAIIVGNTLIRTATPP
jgi:hypothetical protein